MNSTPIDIKNAVIGEINQFKVPMSKSKIDPPKPVTQQYAEAKSDVYGCPGTSNVVKNQSNGKQNGIVKKVTSNKWLGFTALVVVSIVLVYLFFKK